MSVGNPESKFDQVSKLQASLPSSNRCKGPLSVLVQIGDQKELNVSMREREREERPNTKAKGKAPNL